MYHSWRIYLRAFLSLFFLSTALPAQNAPVVHPSARIKAAIDDNQTARLKGQVHRLARAEFDRGAVANDLPMQRMVMLLRGSEEQEQALSTLLTDLHNPASPQYHHWLTPDEFGARFGVADDDLKAIQTWLGSHGFSGINVAAGRRMIEFSGNAGQVAEAFHTEIHNFNVDGEVHLANANDPSIPAAFSSVVTGFVSLHNFRHRPMHRVIESSQWSPAESSTPAFNDAGGKHGMTPYDFATIYNVLPLWAKGIDGTGQSIAIVSRSSGYWSDVSSFRSNFGLPYRDPVYILNGADPGRINDGDAAEMAVDIQWSGAVAKNATINVVISKSTNTADGIDLSAIYAVNYNVAPILEVSYGFCEANDPGDSFHAALWRQAAAQGISVVVSAGDSGAAGCDNPNVNSATHGLGVSGMASTPDNVAVGGTQFTDVGQESTYWAATNDSHGASALSYIPETTWNESGTTGLWSSSGGVSSVCATPAWQAGSGVPSSDPGSGGHHRYLPDVSLAAAEHDGYYSCLFDSCVNFDPTTNQYLHQLVSGTSVSAAAFAGVMALVNQQMGTTQGNPNFYLYPLAKVPGVYHDITSGANAVACSSGSGCVNGLTNGYAASSGFDLATGWGSMDVNALVNNWSSVSFQPTSVTGSATPMTVQHGSNINFTASVSASSGTPTGAISAYVVKNGVTTVLGAADIASGTVFAPSNKAPGGNPVLYFRYGGDGTYGSSTSPPITLTITPEPSILKNTSDTSGHIKLGQSVTLSMQVLGTSGVGIPSGTLSLFQGTIAAGSGQLFPNGSGYLSSYYVPDGPGTYTYTAKYQGDENFAPSSTTLALTFDKADIHPLLLCANGTADVVANFPVTCNVGFVTAGVSRAPTGTLQFYDTVNSVMSPLGDPVVIASGKATITVNNLPTGSHQLSGKYSGDSFFSSNDTSYPASINVIPAGTVTVGVSSSISHQLPGSGFPLFVSVGAQQFGPNLTGKLTLFDGATELGSALADGSSRGLTYSPVVNTPNNAWTIGPHTLTAKYSGDGVWAAKTSTSTDVVISNPDFWLPTLQPVTLLKGAKYFSYLNAQFLGLQNGVLTYQCTGVPAQATCVIDQPSSMYASAGITITTTAPHIITGQNRFATGGLFFAVFPFGAVFIGAVPSRKQKFIVAFCLIVCLAAFVSCGGGGGGGNNGSASGGGTGGGGGTVTDPGTPSGTYTLTITATFTPSAGSGVTTPITHTYSLPLTVQ